MPEAVTTRGPMKSVSQTEETIFPIKVDEASESKPRTSQRNDAQFLKDRVKEFSRAESAESKNRQMALEDLKFKSGDQWPEQIKATRTIEQRPCLTINKMKTFVHQITNDQRQNRPSINVSPIGDKSDPETAKMLRGLIKHIERMSNADVAYDTAFDSAVTMGWGYWRILTEYANDDSFDQTIRIAKIGNPFRVYLDPDHQEPDGSDAKWGFITDLIPRDEYEETWGKQYPAPLPWSEGSTGDEYKNWNTETHIRIAEYFYYVTETRKLLALSNGHIGYKDELAPELLAMIEADPALIRKERDVPVKRVRWCKLTSDAILEENDWLGKWIPIVKVIGDEVNIEGKIILAGLVRDAKDPQRMYNFWCTSETELIALQPKAPWIMEEGQVEGHENRWKESNKKALPYLLYKGVSLGGKPAPAPQRQQFTGPPAGVVQAKIAAAQDMQATTGIRFDATLNERMYDESGKALRELKRVGDLGNFHYVDNLSRSLRFTGWQLIDLVPKVYDTRRVLTILREDDTEEKAVIDPMQQNAYERKQDEQGNVQLIYNPKVGDYAVTVTIGPSFATKRAEAADSMLQFMKVVPQSTPLIGDLIAKNMDWPGAEEIAERLAAQLPPNVLGKDADGLPPEARAIVNNLQTQLQQLGEQHQQALAMLGDKDKDREIERERINKDFEAKVLKISADMEKAALAVADAARVLEVNTAQSNRKMDMDAAQRDADRAAAAEQAAAETKGASE